MNSASFEVRGRSWGFGLIYSIILLIHIIVIIYLKLLFDMGQISAIQFFIIVVLAGFGLLLSLYKIKESVMENRIVIDEFEFVLYKGNTKKHRFFLKYIQGMGTGSASFFSFFFIGLWSLAFKYLQINYYDGRRIKRLVLWNDTYSKKILIEVLRELSKYSLKYDFPIRDTYHWLNKNKARR